MSDAGLRQPRRGFAVASLVLGILSLPTIGLLGVGAMAAVVLGVVALVKARNAPGEYGGSGLAIAGIVLAALSIVVMPFIIGIVAAIAIPSFLRARISANESAVIGDIRTVISAEAAYQTVNGGYYDRLECLAEPAGCIPAYSGPAVLNPEVARAATKNGYRRVFHDGPAVSPRPAAVSPTSMTSFAYVGVPDQKGTTGVRAFCGEASGRICYRVDGLMPEDLPGACPTDCTALR
jgi:type II secretory pathway pseudopilin PulG